MTGTNDNARNLRDEDVRVSNDQEFYAGYRDLPIVKRTWFWVAAGLVILLSGIIIGLAISTLIWKNPEIRRISKINKPQNRFLVASVESQNARLRRQLTSLEGDLTRDVCQIGSDHSPNRPAGVLRKDTPIQQVAPPLSPKGANSITGPQGTNGARANTQQDKLGKTARLPPHPPKGSSPPAQNNPAAAPAKLGKPANGGPQKSPGAPPNRQGNNDLHNPPAGSSNNTQQNSLGKRNLNQLLDDATVLVMAAHSPRKMSTGSGFFINTTTIVTNAHVVGTGSPTVTILNRKLNKRISATIVARRRVHKLGGDDFAILRLSQSINNIKPLPLTRNIYKSQDVIAAGYPGFDLNLQLKEGQGNNIPSSTFTKGAVRLVERYQGRHKAIAHDAEINKGNSGGPLVDYCGRVVGINTFGLHKRTKDEDIRVDFALAMEGVIDLLNENRIPFNSSNGDCN